MVSYSPQGDYIANMSNPLLDHHFGKLLSTEGYIPNMSNPLLDHHYGKFFF